jgi:phage/plasmid-like protein (TIGR03299 family)
MAHNIDTTTGRAAIAFRGSRNDIWHRMGQEMAAGMSTQEWATAAGLDWQARMATALVDLSGPEFAHLDTNVMHGHHTVEGVRHIVRSDTGAVLGTASDRYVPVQPRDVLEWFQRYISVDDRFQLDVAGALKGGAIIWATATFNGPMEIAGDKHVARMLMTTTFDLSGSTINKGTMTRVVCNNTLDAALSDQSCLVRTRHNTKFDPVRVGQELATVAKGFGQYKKMGDAMGRATMTGDQTSRLFKHVLDIPFDAPSAEVSARKKNQFDDLRRAYGQTAQETDQSTAWCALNAVTRYVDHDKSTKGPRYSQDESRFHSAQFGSGAAMKAKAVEYLEATVCPRDDWEKTVLAQPFKSADNDVSSLLKRPFRVN